MKTAIQLTMQDAETGIIATCVLNADIVWFLEDPARIADGSMRRFRPSILRNVQLATPEWQTSHVALPNPSMPLLVRMSWLRRWMSLFFSSNDGRKMDMAES